jgi:hypothetical protein
MTNAHPPQQRNAAEAPSCGHQSAPLPFTASRLPRPPPWAGPGRVTNPSAERLAARLSPRIPGARDASVTSRVTATLRQASRTTRPRSRGGAEGRPARSSGTRARERRTSMHRRCVTPHVAKYVCCSIARAHVRGTLAAWDAWRSNGASPVGRLRRRAARSWSGLPPVHGSTPGLCGQAQHRVSGPSTSLPIRGTEPLAGFLPGPWVCGEMCAVLVQAKAGSGEHEWPLRDAQQRQP